MATPTTIITTALRHLGVIGAAETSVDANDASICLDALKSMLDAWNLNPQDCVGLTELTITPTAGVTSFTIGAAGDIVARQPAHIVKAIYRTSDVDTEVDVIEVADYQEFATKTVQGQPRAVALNRSGATSTVYLYPAADGASQLRMWVTQDVISSFDTLGLSTSLTLPNGYQNALEWCLAEEVADIFSVPSEKLARVTQKANRAHRRIKRVNSRVPQLHLGGEQRDYEIEVGY